ncbi:MAG: hypothetical protein ABIH00_03490 [Armatimonadota bacterium]
MSELSKITMGKIIQESVKKPNVRKAISSTLNRIGEAARKIKDAFIKTNIEISDMLKNHPEIFGK